MCRNYGLVNFLVKIVCDPSMLTSDICVFPCHVSIYGIAAQFVFLFSKLGHVAVKLYFYFKVSQSKDWPKELLLSPDIDPLRTRTFEALLDCLKSTALFSILLVKYGFIKVMPICYRGNPRYREIPNPSFPLSFLFIEGKYYYIGQAGLEFVCSPSWP